MRRLQRLLADLTLLASGTFGALFLRENFEFLLERHESLLPYVAASVVVAIPIFGLLGLNRTVWRYSAMVDYLRIAIAVSATALCATMLLFTYNRLDGIARSMPVLQALVAGLLLIGARIAARLWHSERTPVAPAPVGERSDGENVLLVGLTSLAELYIKALEELARERQTIAGIIDYSARHGGDRVHLYPLFGPDATMTSAIEELAVHGVFVDRVVVTTSLEKLPGRARQDILDFTKVSGIPVEFLAERMGFEAPVSHSAEARVVAADPTPAKTLTFRFSESEAIAISGRPYWLVKRAIDVSVAALLLAVLWPVALAIAFAIACELGPPVLFWQQRPGVGGRPFRLFKFRTMRGTRDASGNLLTEANRLGRIGRGLRKSRLDELPQLWNILIGEMSFVGPRPLLPIDQSASYAARLMVRPGLTGWAQVLGGREVPPADKAALDVWYVMHASLRLDLEILVRTVPVILFGEKVSREAIQNAWDDLQRGGICVAAAAAATQGARGGSGPEKPDVGRPA